MMTPGFRKELHRNIAIQWTSLQASFESMHSNIKGNLLESTKGLIAREQSDQPLTWNKDFLDRHHLFGHIYLRTQEKVFYPYWKNQLSRNSHAKLELEKIGQDLKRGEIKVYLLKGYSLMGEIYKDWGERYISDIDLLVSYDELWKLTDILKMYGYEKKKVARWLGNRHKHLYVKRNDEINLAIEIHTQLFWHTSLSIENDHDQASVFGFAQLNRENQLVHLCGHVGQHSYSRLFWLMDIFKYIDLYKDQINWDSFWQRAEKANLYKACFFTLFLCQKLGLNIQIILFRAPKKKKLSIYLLKKLVSFSFLYHPEKHKIRTFAVKTLIKDSLSDNLKYAYAWLKTFKKRHV